MRCVTAAAMSATAAWQFAPGLCEGILEAVSSSSVLDRGVLRALEHLYQPDRADQPSGLEVGPSEIDVPVGFSDGAAEVATAQRSAAVVPIRSAGMPD